MNGCQTCGGFGMHHDPIAHDRPTGQRTRDGRPLSHWSIVGHDENGDLDGEVCRCEISDNHFTDGRPWPDDAVRPRKVIVLHMVYPDGTHTGDCEGCAWAQS